MNYYFVLFLCLFELVSCIDLMRSILVNDQVIENVKPTTFPINYMGSYEYNDGELAKFTCIRDSHYNLHTLTYLDRVKKYDSSGVMNNITSLYVKLQKKNAPKFIECNMTKLYPKKVIIVIRIKLELQQETAFPRFKINNLLLSPLITSNYLNKNYTYEYYNGEKLYINTFTTYSWNLNINCTSSDKIIADNIGDQSDTYFNVTLNTKYFENKVYTISCLFTYPLYNYNVELKLVRSPDSFPRIDGVSLPRVLAKFVNTSEARVKVFYSYLNEENLVLNCTMNVTGPKWKFNENEVSNKPVSNEYKLDADIHQDVQSFQLKENINSSVLTCAHSMKAATEHSQIVLVRLGTNENDSSNTMTDMDQSYINSNKRNFNAQYNETDDDFKYFYTIIGASVAIICVTVILITILVCWKKRNVISESESTEITYENLPEHNKSLSPQRNIIKPTNNTEGLYSNTNNEQPYAQVIPKNQRNKVTEIYSEPLTNDSSCDYATPYKNNKYTSLKDTEIVVKLKNTGVSNNLGPLNGNNYAEVIPKALRPNTNINKVLTTNDGYSEIDLKRIRAHSDKKKYANVFDVEKYANTNSSDYVEPAYSTVGKSS